MDEYKVYMPDYVKEDLSTIYNYILSNFKSIQIANRISFEIQKGILSLEIFPFRNPIMDCDTARKYELRSELVGNYYIIYTIEKDIVKIIAIMYAKSNIETKLAEDDFKIERLMFSSPK